MENNISDISAAALSAAEEAKGIKRSFRLYMNGVAAQSMRDKGLDYKVIWGIPVTRIQTMALEHKPSRELATLLWQSDVRECKLLAMMLMPADSCDEALALSWVADCKNTEMAELIVFSLLQRLPCANKLAVRLLGSDGKWAQVCAFHLVSRLAVKGIGLHDDEAVARLAATVAAAVNGSDAVLRHAAFNCATRYVDRGLYGADLLVSELKSRETDIF